MYSAPAYCCQVSGIYPDCPVFWLFVRYKNDSNTGQCMCPILLYLQYLNSFCQCPVYLREPPDNPNGQTCKHPKCQWQLSMYMASIRKYLLKNKFLFKLKCLNF